MAVLFRSFYLNRTMDRANTTPVENPPPNPASQDGAAQ